MIILSVQSVSDSEYAVRSKRIPYYVRGLSKKAIPVSEHIVLVNGYYIYNKHTKKPLVKPPFKRLVHADAVARAITKTYGDYQEILKDEEWSPYFFDLLRYTLDDGEHFAEFIKKLDSLYPNYVSWDNITDALR